ncbi:MAG: hypothetical protein ACFE96_06375 [Candidatus Hermodarchaeota archaeon]
MISPRGAEVKDSNPNICLFIEETPRSDLIEGFKETRGSTNKELRNIGEIYFQ